MKISENHPSAQPDDGRPRLEVADIIRSYGELYRQTYATSAEQRKVMHAIASCRTAALGGHLDVCNNCDYLRPSYNSCRNRHCPKCQSLSQARWIAERKARILPVRHFHLVFTLPAELRPLARANRRVVFDILFQAAARTLLQFGKDKKWLGAQLGLTLVLHTWSRDLRFHPHVHCVVTDGGLTSDGARWIEGRGGGKFLFPVKALSKVFRAKFIMALVRARNAGTLRFSGACANLASDDRFLIFKDELFRKDWVVYAQRPFLGAEHVFEYLGRYTHRVGISNHRLINIADDSVCFRTRDGVTATLHALEFIRRFLLHVLPKHFVKIRHFGLLASSNVKTRLKTARALLETTPIPAPAAPASDVSATYDWREHFAALTGIDLDRCPRCKVGIIVAHPLPLGSSGLNPRDDPAPPLP
jgi:hypothetical protein